MGSGLLGYDGGMAMETTECAHDVCQCMVMSEAGPETGNEPSEAFCSEHCRRHEDDEEETACACGHPPCNQP